MDLPDDFPFFRIREMVMHKKTGRIGIVTNFAHPGTDIWVDDTGPYPQMDFIRLVPEQKSVTTS